MWEMHTGVINNDFFFNQYFERKSSLRFNEGILVFYRKCLSCSISLVDSMLENGLVIV